MFLAEICEVTGSRWGWPEAVTVCVVCLAIVAVFWAAAWSEKK